MRPVVVLLALALVPLALPPASAASCDAVTKPHPEVAGEYAVPGSDGTHVWVDWWYESNGVAGLQTATCTHDGVTVASDKKYATTSVDPSGVVDFSGGCLVLVGWHVCVF